MAQTGWAYFGPYTKGKASIQKLWDSVNAGNPVSVDIETISIEDTTLIGYSLGINPLESFWFFPEHEFERQIKAILASDSILKVFHNGSFDRPSLEELMGITIRNHTDTMFMAQLLGIQGASLQNLSGELLHKWDTVTIKDLLAKYNTKDMLGVPVEETAKKCCTDTCSTIAIYHKLHKIVPTKAMDLELRVQPVIEKMNKTPIHVDTDRLDEHITITERKVTALKMKCEGMGFNPGSSKSLAAILKRRGHVVDYNYRTGNPKLPKEMLQTRYAHDPIAQDTLVYRKEKSKLSTRLIAVRDALVNGNQLFVTYKQGGAQSGRISTTPNSQNIEFGIRDIYVPSPGNIFEVWDFSQIELRILAYFSQDYRMAEIYRKGLSIHHNTAVFTYGQGYNQEQYKYAKNTNFTIIYLGDENTLWQRYLIPYDKGRYLIGMWPRIYSGAWNWITNTAQRVIEQGYAQTYYGRIRRFDTTPTSKQYYIAKCQREGVNHEIQGTAGEANKELLIWCHNQGIDIVNTVHDEVVQDIDLHRDLPMPDFNGFLPLNTPLDGGRGFDWKEAKLDADS